MHFYFSGSRNRPETCYLLLITHDILLAYAALRHYITGIFLLKILSKSNQDTICTTQNSSRFELKATTYTINIRNIIMEWVEFTNRLSTKPMCTHISIIYTTLYVDLTNSVQWRQSRILETSETLVYLSRGNIIMEWVEFTNRFSTKLMCLHVWMAPTSVLFILCWSSGEKNRGGGISCPPP